jgi:hypothetical protein
MLTELLADPPARAQPDRAAGVRFAERRGFVEIDRYVLGGGSDLWLDLRLESTAA